MATIKDVEDQIQAGLEALGSFTRTDSDLVADTDLADDTLYDAVAVQVIAQAQHGANEDAVVLEARVSVIYRPSSNAEERRWRQEDLPGIVGKDTLASRRWWQALAAIRTADEVQVDFVERSAGGEGRVNVVQVRMAGTLQE